MRLSGMVWAHVFVCAVLGVGVLAGCARDSRSASKNTSTSAAVVTASTTTSFKAPTTTLPGTPTLAVFEVPRGANCRGGMRAAPVSIRYETVSAVAVVLLVDDVDPDPQAARPLSGAVSLDVPCDGRPHRVMLRAAGINGTNAEQERVIAP